MCGRCHRRTAVRVFSPGKAEVFYAFPYGGTLGVLVKTALQLANGLIGQGPLLAVIKVLAD